ncbi:MAG: DNA repair exonuclease [Thermotaleaceae bacterium]
MEKVKILHCGDFHFDTPFYGLSPGEAEKRKEDLRETFGRIIDLAKDTEIDLMFISGDFFDNEKVMKTTLVYIIKKLEEIPQIQVFISPGNHDPYTHKSYYHLIQWPENVHVFSSKMEGIAVPHLNTWVYGIGFSKHHEKKSLLENFTLENPSCINLMVVHGEVVSGEQESDYNPIPIETIEKSGLDYLALGHRHGFSGIQKSGNTYWSYCGNPEGRGFDELGAKGIVMGEIAKGYCHLHFHEICKRKLFEKIIDIQGAGTYEEIIEEIYAQVQDLSKEKNLYKLVLKGTLSEGFILHPDVIEEKLGDNFYYVKVVDETEEYLDIKELQDSFSLRGLFIRAMEEKIKKAANPEEKKRLELALKAGIRALRDGEVVFE